MVDDPRLLVVDDEETLCRACRRILRPQGFQVEQSTDARRGLRRATEEDYSAVLLDIKMPGMSGIESYKHIQKIARSYARRVIFITGDVMEPTTKDFLDKTKAHYIAKPFNIEQLKNDINRILTKELSETA